MSALRFDGFASLIAAFRSGASVSAPARSHPYAGPLFLRCSTSWREEDGGLYATQTMPVLNRTFRPIVPKTPSTRLHHRTQWTRNPHSWRGNGLPALRRKDSLAGPSRGRGPIVTFDGVYLSKHTESGISAVDVEENPLHRQPVLSVGESGSDGTGKGGSGKWFLDNV